MVECNFTALVLDLWICCDLHYFILGLKFFELVSILFAIVPEYGNEYTRKENKN